MVDGYNATHTLRGRDYTGDYTRDYMGDYMGPDYTGPGLHWAKHCSDGTCHGPRPVKMSENGLQQLQNEARQTKKPEGNGAHQLGQRE